MPELSRRAPFLRADWQDEETENQEGAAAERRAARHVGPGSLGGGERRPLGSVVGAPGTSVPAGIACIVRQEAYEAPAREDESAGGLDHRPTFARIMGWLRSLGCSDLRREGSVLKQLLKRHSPEDVTLA